MGITGAAVASSLSYTAVGLFVVWYFLHVTKCPWQELLPRWEDVEEYRRRWRGRRRKAEPEPEPEMIVAAEGVS